MAYIHLAELTKLSFENFTELQAIEILKITLVYLEQYVQ